MQKKDKPKLGRPLVRINSTPYINEYYVRPIAPRGLEDRLDLDDSQGDRIIVRQNNPDYSSNDEEEHNIEFGGRRIRRKSRKNKRKSRKTLRRHKRRSTKRRRRH